VITPFHFLEAAKQASLLSVITKNVINSALNHIQNSDIHLSFNVTDQDLVENYLHDFLLIKCERFNIQPSQITLEILENITNFDNNNWLDQLKMLKQAGFKLAIDDFGSESSNFARLIDIDADLLKIDGAFIKNLDSDEKSQKIVTSLVKLARDIGLKVVAEYVHNQAIQDKVKSYGIDFTQGYYFSEPKPFKERYQS
jgi:c-di-GMP phosphodiesterase